MARVGLDRLEYLVERLARELDMSSSSITGLGNPVVSIIGSGTTRVLTGADSGAIVRMGGSNASTATLPAAVAGLNFRFVAATEHAHVINGGATKIQGGYHHNTNAATVARVAVVDRSSLALHSSNAKIGDTLDMWCDGTNWYVSGIVNNAITQS